MTSVANSRAGRDNESVKPTTVGDRSNGKNISEDVSPPLPPRGVKSILSVKDYKKANDNRYVKFSDVEQKRVPNGKVKSMVESRENATTPPPKIPPRNRIVKTSAVNVNVKRETFERQNGKVHPYDKNEIISAFDKLAADIDRSDKKSRGITLKSQEPQPLTRTNVTCHDRIWNNKDEDEDNKGDDGLSPPLKHITLESTQELLEKFDPLDVLDSGSDHSDSSADTMIMMTTEEEEQNKVKIHQSMQNYREGSNRTNKPYSEGFELEISQQNQENEMRMKQKLGNEALNQLSPKSEDTDDGYGTNSSQGTTISSPLSSSLNSLETSDFENSTNGSMGKIPRNTSNNNSSSAIQNSSRGTWAVRRRTRMSEKSEDANSVQERLRQLTIIEEEDNSQDTKRRSEHKGRGDIKETRRRERETTPTNCEQNYHEEINGPVPPDLRKFEGDLFDKWTDMDRNYRNYYGFDYDSEEKNEKVMYFQHKMLKQSYGSDNYYTPRSYQEQTRTEKDFDSLMSFSQGSLPRNINIGRDYSNLESSSYRSNASSGIASYDERPNHMTNVSYDQIPLQGTLPGMPSKGQFASLDNINANGRKPLFASSADIHKLFQSRDNIHDQLQRPANCRHSFHAMPCTQQWLLDASQNQADASVPRERASSTSAAMKSKSSWNPFGGMFSRKKKSEQNKSNQNLQSNDAASAKSDRKSRPNVGSANVPEVPVRQPIIKSNQRGNQTQSSLGRTPSFRKYAEKSGLATLPNGDLQELPFRTVTVVEASGTKLSTLV
ncbi:hypothetical protein FSP39_010721 [Pinctada imbricata]|uniref:Uncharacterized protein n=1 Tax=Pinctada imbricata TaxID=66713 RepID=A0AA88YI79_PINIB|nr:hypothetical protein FSP39_010721 [Pinctada imbricata]